MVIEKIIGDIWADFRPDEMPTRVAEALQEIEGHLAAPEATQPECPYCGRKFDEA